MSRRSRCYCLHCRRCRRLLTGQVGIFHRNLRSFALFEAIRTPMLGLGQNITFLSPVLEPYLLEELVRQLFSIPCKFVRHLALSIASIF